MAFNEATKIGNAYTETTYEKFMKGQQVPGPETPFKQNLGQRMNEEINGRDFNQLDSDQAEKQIETLKYENGKEFNVVTFPPQTPKQLDEIRERKLPTTDFEPQVKESDAILEVKGYSISAQEVDDGSEGDGISYWRGKTPQGVPAIFKVVEPSQISEGDDLTDNQKDEYILRQARREAEVNMAIKNDLNISQKKSNYEELKAIAAQRSIKEGLEVWNPKRLDANISGANDIPEAFEKEGERLNKGAMFEVQVCEALLGVPNVIQILDKDTGDKPTDYTIIVFEDPGGRSMRFQKFSEYSSRTVGQIFSDVALGIDGMHSKGIIHRNINPEVIIVPDNFEQAAAQPDRPTCVLSEFSEALKPFDSGIKGVRTFLLDAYGGENPRINTSFAAPEVLEGKEHTVQTDLKAFACTMLGTLLTSRPREDRFDDDPFNSLKIVYTGPGVAGIPGNKMILRLSDEKDSSSSNIQLSHRSRIELDTLFESIILRDGLTQFDNAQKIASEVNRLMKL